MRRIEGNAGSRDVRPAYASWRAVWTCGLVVWLSVAGMAWGVEYPGPEPGAVTMHRQGQAVTLENRLLSVTWDLAAKTLRMPRFGGRLSGLPAEPQGQELLEIRLADGRVLAASQFRFEGQAIVERLEAKHDSLRLAPRFAGWRIRRLLVAATSPEPSGAPEKAPGQLRLEWRIVFRDQANYVEQEIALGAPETVRVSELTLRAGRVPGAKVLGTVDGSPVVAGNAFLACEHPMAKSRVEDGRVVLAVNRYRPIEPNEPWTLSFACGTSPDGQLRRAFLHYLERERARPYRPLAYYISWFDLAAPGLTMDERQCLDVIQAFGREMVKRRGVRLDAFVFDDGWDDTASLWRFHQGFPQGFAPLQRAAADYNAFLGTWVSPWGGYGKLKQQRLAYGKQQGFETNRSGFSLAGPKYYQRFSSVCGDMMRRYGVKYLKFDGMGGGAAFASGAGKGCEADMEALLRLLDDLRRQQPDAFFNTTSGTWPSPYWLQHGDSVWRGGEDVGFCGQGSKRQQWITYRDAIGYRIRTSVGPLYPFNSLKFQSFICARLSLAALLPNDPKDLLDDLHMAAGSGTQVQEFFVTPSLLTAPVWDALAEAVGWVQRNADVLADSHGIGGDPSRGEPYGFASWTRRGGILVLRNPSQRAAEIPVDLETAFELPPGAAKQYSLTSAWRGANAGPPLVLCAGQKHTFKLAPLEVLTFDASPASRP